MARKYQYVIDGVKASQLAGLRRALQVTSGIRRSHFDAHASMLTIEADRDPESTVRMACSVVGASFRTKV
jgi:hypothetical protein